MKKLLSVMFAFMLAFSAAVFARAQELKPFEVTEPCYVRAGGTFDFQTWDTETSYQVEDETVATVDKNGVVHGIRPGVTVMNVVVYDEKYVGWAAGGYSFSEDITVYDVDTVLSEGENSVENSAVFTPDEDGYYSFTGNCDLITVSDGSIKYSPAVDFHDDTEYSPTPDCCLKAGVAYTVSTANYDETYDIPVANVKIEKSIPVIISAAEKNGAAEITVSSTFVNKYGGTVFAILRKTSDSDFETVGYVTVSKYSDEKTVVFTDSNVEPGTTYTYTVRMVDKTGGSDFLSGFDKTGKTVKITANTSVPDETHTDSVSPDTGSSENLLFVFLPVMLAAVVLIAFFKKKMRKINY